MALSKDQDLALALLMRRAQNGDRAGYNELLRDVAKILRPFVISRVGLETAADDVIQDILISIHLSRHTYAEGRPLAPWLYAIARCRIADYWRRQARQILTEPAGEEMSEAVSVQRGEATGRVWDLLESLPERQRHVVRLLKLEGCSLQEAAQKLNMTTGAAKVAAHRAYRRLREQFDKGFDGNEQAN